MSYSGKYGITGDRWYVADDGGKLIVIGWDLLHEPTPDNECGYQIVGGPFATKAEANNFVQEST
jgi:hypothetical protein